jgi:ATP-dependent 26S proteasome regulatory subunit
MSDSLIYDPIKNAFEEKLGNLFKARFPFVYLRSWEEWRAESIIRSVAKDKTRVTTLRRVYIWDAAFGIQSESGIVEGLKLPVSVLDWMENADEPAIYVLKDVSSFISIEQGAPDGDDAVVRRLQKLAEKMQQAASPKTLVFLSGGVILPKALECLTHFMDLPLPSVDELGELLKEMRQANDGVSRVRFELQPEEEERLLKAALGLTLKEAENAFAYAMVHDGRLCLDDINIVMEEKYQVIRKSDLLEFIHTDIKMSEVGGLDNLKIWLSKRQNAWLDAAARYGLPAPRGILLTGVPGSGKSLVAKTIGSSWQLPLLRLDPGRLYSSMMGSSEENVRKVIAIAEAVAPCVLWIDEIEKGFSTGNGQGDSGTSKRVFGTFLTWLQEKTKPVFVVATANNIDVLPPEFLRKGRFDEIFFVGLPNATERQVILILHLQKRLKDPAAIGNFKLTQEDLTHLVQLTEGFNGAEIEQVVISALFEAFAENRGLLLSDLQESVQNTVPLSVTQAEQISAMMEWAKYRAVPASKL